MRIWRLAVAVAVIAALVVVSLQTSAQPTAAVAPVPRTTSALGQAFSAASHLDSIQNFGCQDQWAYVWATVGTGEHAFGVTEVLNYRAPGRWILVSRVTDCKPTILPHVIYRQGCFSN